MLPRTDAFARETSKASFKPDILVQVQIAGQTYTWCCAERPLAIGGSTQLVENIVTDVSGVGRSVDALTRAVSISEASITFDRSEYLRTLFSQNRLFGQPVRITWGPESLAASAATDFLPLWAGVITEIEPEAGQITLRCHDLFTVLSGDISTYSAVDKHPLQIITDLLALSGVPSSIIDAGSFDPDRYAGGTYPISHWNTTRSLHEGVDRRVTSQTSASSLITEVGLLLNGALLIDEAGLLSYRVYDPGVAPIDAWTYDDVDEPKSESSLSNIINHAVFRGAWDGTTNSKTILTGSSRHSSIGVIGRIGNVARDSDGSNAGFQFSIVRDDFISQKAYAYPGQDGRQLSEHVESKWVGVMSYLVDSGPLVSDPANPSAGSVDATRSTADVFGLGATSQVGDWLRLGGGWISGFSGLPRYQVGANGAGVWDGKTKYLPDASAGRLVYLLVDSEIIACDAVFAGSSTWLGIGGGTTNTNTIGNVGTGDVPPSGAPASACFRILQRGALGTTAAAHAGGGQPGGTAGTTSGAAPGASIVSSKVYDVTIPVTIVKQWLDRFSDGCPEISVPTGLHKSHCQLGDLVTLTNDFYVAYGLLGLSSSNVWEIIGKDVLITADSAMCKWRLALSRQPPAYSNGNHMPTTVSTSGSLSSVIDAKTNAITAVGGAGGDVAGLNTSKLGAASVTGLVVTIPAGTISRPGLSAGVPGAIANLVPNKDNYITHDVHSYGYVLTPVPTGAPAPLVPDSHAFHSKAVAGASSATITPLLKSSPLTSSIVTPSAINPNTNRIKALNLNADFGVQTDPSQPPDGWAVDAANSSPSAVWGVNLNVESDDLQSGVRALEMPAQAMPTSGSYAFVSTPFPVLAGRIYQLEFLSKKRTLSNRFGAQLSIVWLDSTGATISSSGFNNFAYTNSWKFFRSNQAAAPATARFAKIHIEQFFNATDSTLINYCGCLEMPVAFCYFKTAARNLVVNTFTSLNCESKEFDYTNGAYDNVTNFQFTAPEDGLYHFYAGFVVGATVAAGRQVTIALYKNGSEARRGPQPHTGAAGLNIGSAVSGGLQLAAGDTVAALGFSGDAVALQTTNSGECYFGGFRVS